MNNKLLVDIEMKRIPVLKEVVVTKDRDLKGERK